MWLNRCLRIGRRAAASAASLLALASSLLAQSADSVWWIEISATQDFVLSARTLQMEVYATTAVGVVLPGLRPEWRSSNPLVAAVDAGGRVRGLLPGRAYIEAFSGEAAGGMWVKVHPGRIEIQPDEIEIEIGQQVAVTARALDADGSPIPGARFVWYSGVPGVASVDGAGMVTGKSGGSVTLTALLDIGEGGLGFSAQARATVHARRDFRVTRLVSNELLTRPVSLRTIDRLSYGGGDRIGFIGGLSNGGQAVMAIDNGALRVLALAGEHSDAIGRVISFFGGVAVNTRGDLLVNAAPWWAQWHFLLFRGPAATTPEAIPVPNEYGGIQILPRSLGENGDVAFFGWNNRGQNVVVRRSDGRIERVVTQGDQLPGFDAPRWFGEVAISQAGNVLFSAQGNNRWGYFWWDGRQVRKIFAEGEAVLGRTVRWSNMPVQAATGDFYARMGLDDSQQIARLSGGVWSSVAATGQTLSNGVRLDWTDNFFDVREGRVLFSGGSNRGNGLFRLEGGNLEILAPFGESAEAGQWRWFGWGFLNRQGGAIMLGAQGNTLSRLARLEGGVTTLAATGTSLNVEAPPAIAWDTAYTGGVYRSHSNGLFRAGRDQLEPIAVQGDLLPGGQVLAWIGAFSTNRNGDVAFQAGTLRNQVVYLSRSGRLSTLAAAWSDYKGPGGTNIHWFGGSGGPPPIAVNNRGQAAIGTGYDGGQGLLLFTEGSTVSQGVMANGTAAPGGGIYQGTQRVAIDENGRVLFQANLSTGGNALFLWQNGQVSRLRQTGDPGPGGLRLTDVLDLKAAGDRVYALFRYGNWEAFEIWEFNGATAQVRVPSTAPGFCGQEQWFSVNTSGDILHRTCGGREMLVRKADGRLLRVAAIGERSSGGDWFLGLMNGALGDSGEVWFGGISPTGVKDRVGAFQAVPQ